MTNQEQYESMIIPEPLYTIDHAKALLNAVREIKEHCTKFEDCIECQFYDDNEGCILDECPKYWEV